MINVISKTQLALVWYVYNGLVEVDGPFGSREEAYKAAKVHDSRQEPAQRREPLECAEMTRKACRPNGVTR